jgi:uncharacterized surface protein with fasciclin (FAS1) repeats
MNLSTTRPRATQAIFADILAIENPIRGSLTKVMRPLKNGTAYPHYHLQKWEKGKNVTQHIPIEKVEEVQKGIEQHKKLRELFEELENAGLFCTLNGMPGDVKKNSKSSNSAKSSPSKSPKSSSRPSKA